MGQSEGESLVALEHLMGEFFDGGTSNIRKQEIEKQLNAFASQRDSWKFCVYSLRNSTNQYVAMYGFSTIESVINRQWVSLSWEDRTELKNALNIFFVENNGVQGGHFIRNKLAKLLVDIARCDWPHFYPDFLTNVLQLIQSDNLKLNGLVWLRTTSEEFMSPRPDVSSRRRDELTRLMQQNAPELIQTLGRILNEYGSKRFFKATTTPPPSPTNPQAPPNLSHTFSPASFSRNNSKTILSETLSTLQHIFSWVNLSLVPVGLIDGVFTAIFNNLTDEEIPLIAMSALNELLYRKCVPPGSQNIFFQIYHNIIILLKEISPVSSKLEYNFVEKFTELVSLLIEQHLWRLEAEPGFTSIEFLTLFYQLTIHSSSPSSYLDCLNVWATFVKQIKPQNAQKYSEALIGLIIAVLNKLQFGCNASQLDDIDDTIDDNEESEWKNFQKSSIEIIAAVAEFAPVETITRVLALWKNTIEIYAMLENLIEPQTNALRLNQDESLRLRHTLKDLASLTQTLGRLSTFFMDQDSEYFKQAAHVIENLLTQLIQIASISTKGKFFSLKFNGDFIEAHCQLLSALQTWWLYLNDERYKGFKNAHLDQLLGIVLSTLHPQGVPQKVVISAAALFLSITSSSDPVKLIQRGELREFLRFAANLKYEKEVKSLVIAGSSNILIRPWGEISQDDANNRQHLIGMFFDDLTKDFKSINVDLIRTGSPVQLKRMIDTIKETLTALTCAVEHSKSFPLTSKKLLHSALKTSIEHSMVLYPHFVKYSESNESFLNFYSILLAVLQQQMGPLAKNAVNMFLEVAMSEEGRKDFSNLDKLLQIFQLVIEAPGTTYKNYIEGVLKVCMENIYPMVIAQNNEHPDCVIALLNLLHSILSHRWNYFYLSQIRLGNSPGCSDTEPSADRPQQPEKLLAILQVFGYTLLQSDINTFKTSLGSLENLNTKWKLYHKALFKEQLLSQFLTVLLQSLLDKSHSLLNDDVLLALYNMSSVHFETFFVSFLPNFLNNIEGLTKEQKNGLVENFKHQTDMPTFVLHVQRLVNDVHCFWLCNASLPPGSVVL